MLISIRDRIELDDILRSILGEPNVYFQPNENVRMRYPAIRYSLYDIPPYHADNFAYKTNKAYQLILITPDPENPYVDKLKILPMCAFDRYYTSDNLNHYVFTIYI